MIIIKRKQGYGAKRKYVQGRGFVDSLTSSLKSIGSYISQNRDLIAKPLLGAVGNCSNWCNRRNKSFTKSYYKQKSSKRSSLSYKRSSLS